MMTRLRHIAQVNPATPKFDTLDDELPVTFAPLETVWSDSRGGFSRTRLKADVATGYVRFQEGDVLLPKTAPTFQHGRTVVARGLVNGVGAGSSELHVLRARTGHDPRFIAYVVRGQPFLSEGVTAYEGVAGLQRVSAEFVADWPIHDFSTDEQSKIADFLDVETGVLDRAVGLRQRQRALLIERQRAATFVAITGSDQAGGRVFGRLPWALSTPAAWPVAKITHHARLGSGHTPSRSRPDWWQNCAIPWITTGEVHQVRDDSLEVLMETREMLSEAGIANSSATVHPAGTVVLCRTAASAGYSAVMGHDMATSQDFATWTCDGSLDPYYLLWCLRAMRADLLGRLAIGATFKTIYMPDIQTIRVPVPPVATQRDIVDRIRAKNEATARAVRLIDREIDVLDSRKQSLITACVGGTIKPSQVRRVA